MWGNLRVFRTSGYPDQFFPEFGKIKEYMVGNPLPYMMLISGAAYPMTFHKEDQLLFLLLSLLEETLEDAGCHVVWVNQMPALDGVIGFMTSHLS
jgi:hypothetical protein